MSFLDLYLIGGVLMLLVVLFVDVFIIDGPPPLAKHEVVISACIVVVFWPIFLGAFVYEFSRRAVGSARLAWSFVKRKVR